MFCLCILCIVTIVLKFVLNSFDINLPNEHIPYYFANYPKISEKCDKIKSCPYKKYLTNKSRVCWGYEPFCNSSEGYIKYSKPYCSFDSRARGWAKSYNQQIELFEKQADFLYIKDHILSLTTYCKANKSAGLKSELRCSKNLEFCKGRNIQIDFRKLPQRLNNGEKLRYSMDVLNYNDINGHCIFNEMHFKKQLNYISPLQSWAPELRFFQSLKQAEDYICDVTVNATVYIMKIDATVNMYHHFCDFINLYASQHVNSVKNSAAFSKKNRIFIWESIDYISSFEPIWNAFTDYPLWNLKTFSGKRVCFQRLIMPMLPRMIFGLYYNTPIVPSCQNSGLFHAFSKFILHRLEISQKPSQKIKVLFLSRKTKYRRVLNENILLNNLQTNRPFLNIEKAVFDWDVPFMEQIQTVSNSDILIGMHGAGLTHLLFLPDWAVVFELYNCGDRDCYKDLARLRGVKYITWQKHNTVYKENKGKHPHDGTPHEKFTNYKFDVNDFISHIDECIEYVKLYKPQNRHFTDEL